MEKTKRLPLVLWTVDPFAENAELQREAAWALKALAGKRTLLIEPIYVAPRPLPNLRNDLAEEAFRELQVKAQAEFRRIIRDIPLPALLPLKLLEVNKRSVGHRVNRVLAYAEDFDAELIVASTRSRTGPVRWFVGSFVETLSLRSHIPLLVVNPEWLPTDTMATILHPTDLSEGAHEVFHRVLELARETGSKVHIFHRYIRTPAAEWSMVPNLSVFYPEYERQETEALHCEARSWVDEARRAGVTAQYEIETAGNETVAEAILQATRKDAQKSVSLIAMAAESGAIESAFLGSVTRQVLREASVPVWVLHGDEKESLLRHEGIGAYDKSPRAP